MKEEICEFYRIKKRNDTREALFDTFIDNLIKINGELKDNKIRYDVRSMHNVNDRLAVLKRDLIFYRIIAEIQMNYANQEISERHSVVVYDKNYYKTFKKFAKENGFSRIIKCWDGCENE